MSGPLAAANVYRFSSKEFHEASGLLHYLYRYYDSRLLRWVIRDSLGEFSAVNLYSYVDNDALNKSDLWGLSSRDVANIIKQAQKSIDRMTKNAERINDGIFGGTLNNFTAWWCGKVCRVPDDANLKGCCQQSDVVL